MYIHHVLSVYTYIHRNNPVGVPSQLRSFAVPEASFGCSSSAAPWASKPAQGQRVSGKDACKRHAARKPQDLYQVVPDFAPVLPAVPRKDQKRAVAHRLHSLCHPCPAMSSPPVSFLVFPSRPPLASRHDSKETAVIARPALTGINFEASKSGG